MATSMATSKDTSSGGEANPPATPACNRGVRIESGRFPAGPGFKPGMRRQLGLPARRLKTIGSNCPS
jgi:hypothetical protein